MRNRSQRGQATVEFALIIPLVVVVLLAVVQIGLVVHAQLHVAHIAREVARAASVDPTVRPDALVERFVEPGSSLAERLQIAIVMEPAALAGRDLIVVRVHSAVPVVSALFDPLVGGFEVSAEVHMLVEN